MPGRRPGALLLLLKAAARVLQMACHRSRRRAEGAAVIPSRFSAAPAPPPLASAAEPAPPASPHALRASPGRCDASPDDWLSSTRLLAPLLAPMLPPAMPPAWPG